MRYLLAAAAVLACASLSAAQSLPATEPAEPTASAETRGSTFGTKHRAEAVRIAEELVEGLASDDYEMREAAQAALTDVLRAYMQAVAKRRNDKDPEVRKRAAAAMEAMAREAFCQHAASSLDEAQRTKVKRLRAKHPGIFPGVFSPSHRERVEAINRLAERPDTEALAEPILVRCLRDGSERIQEAAATAACSGEYKSGAMVDALIGVLIQKKDTWDWYSNTPPSRSMPHLRAVDALAAIRSPRAVPWALALMKETGHNTSRFEPLSRILVAVGSKRAVPYLVEVLDMHTRGGVTWEDVTRKGPDVALMALLELTGQKPDKYGFFRAAQRTPDNFYGFKSQKDRQKAIAKFRIWWEKNRNTEPYKDLKPLVIPDLSDPRRLPNGMPAPFTAPEQAGVVKQPF